MYEELLSSLKICIDSNTSGCNNCMVHTAEYGDPVCTEQLLKLSADAIEELQQIANHYEEESKGWWLAACDAKEERERLKEQAKVDSCDGAVAREKWALSHCILRRGF